MTSFLEMHGLSVGYGGTPVVREIDLRVAEGEVVATRTEAGLRIRAGDVEVAPVDEGYEVRLKKS